MAPRSNWKGYLRLSLVSCPVALYPATSDSEKVRFHRINKQTGNRVKMQNVDAETGDAIEKDDLGRGYEVGKGHIIPIEDEVIEAIALESKRVIEIDQFVPAAEIDQLYNVRPYYIAPMGEVGMQAFAVIREAIKQKGMVAIGRVMLTSREHVIALEPRGKGIMGTLLRYPYEVRDHKEFFDEIPDETVPKDMLELASHIVETKSGHFEPERFEDRYENALRELIAMKQKGEAIRPIKPSEPPRVVNLMEALRRSIESSAARPSERAPERRKHAAARKRPAAKRSGASRKAG